MIAPLLGLDPHSAFGIDENSFKTRDERRLAEQARAREARIDTAEHIQEVQHHDEVVDAHLDRKALRAVGRKPILAAPTGSEAPSPEASALKAQELKV